MRQGKTLGIMILAAAVSLCMATPAGAVIAQVQSANLSSAAATVTWTTLEASWGRVDYGTTTALGSSLWDPRPDDDVHFVEIEKLEPETLYYFAVVSGGETDDNGGAYYSFTTAAVGQGTPYLLYGTLRQSDGVTPAAGALVHLTLRAGVAESLGLAALSDGVGLWSFNLGNLKDPTGGQVFAYSPGDSALLDFLGVAEGYASAGFEVLGASPQDCGPVDLAGGTGVPEEPPAPLRGRLAAHPNPFNPITCIEFSLSSSAEVHLKIYGSRGRLLRRLLGGERLAGTNRIVWDGRDDSGRLVPSGNYLCQLRAGEEQQSLKLSLVK